MEMELRRIREAAFRELELAQEVGALNEIRVRVLGKKGDLTAVLRGMGAMDAAERPRIGQLVNDLRQEFEAALNERMALLKDAALTKRLEADAVTRSRWLLTGSKQCFCRWDLTLKKVRKSKATITTSRR